MKTAKQANQTTEGARRGPFIQRQCSHCAEEQEEEAPFISPSRVGRVQTKLAVGTPNDIYEQEADRIADQVMAMPAHDTIRRSPIQVQRVTESSSGQTTEAPASVERVLSSPGQPLESGLREEMEGRFGYDFSGVRVHSDDAVALSTSEISANAYTVGHHVAFAQGKYQPKNHSGRKLLAHELVHVAQQQNQIARNIQFQLRDKWSPIRSDEQIIGTTGFEDRYREQTGEDGVILTAGIDDATTAEELGLTDRGVGHTPRWVGQVRTRISIFLPIGAQQNQVNKIHLFFGPQNSVELPSPGSDTDPRGQLVGNNFVNFHGLRGSSAHSDWILIAIPGLRGPRERAGGFVAIDEPAILDILRRIHRRPQIDALRLSAHSRGHRGLQWTIGNRLIPIGLVERVTIYDAGYSGVSRTLERTGISGTRVRSYQVTESDEISIPGATHIRLNAAAMRAIGYCRLILDTYGAEYSRATWLIPHGVYRQLLLDLPERGRFTTSDSPAPGQVNIFEYINQHRTEIRDIDRNRDQVPDGLRTFIYENNLMKMGRQRFTPGIEAHHLFVAEFAHEAVE